MTAGEAKIIAVPDTIPFEYRNNKIIVKGKINQEEYDFVVDTGAPTVIWEEVAQELQLVKTNASITSNDANGTKQKLDFYKSETVEMGALKVEGMNVSALSTLSEELKCYANGGIIGGNFLIHYNWQIDYENKRLIACSNLSNLSISPDAIKINAIISQPQGKIVISDISLLGIKEEFALDTGNGGYLNLGMEIWNQNKIEEKVKRVDAYGYSNLSVGGRKLITTNTIQTNLTTPMGTIKDAVINVDTKNSLIGNAYLSQFGLITIDYTSKDGAVYFPRKKVTSADNMSFGFIPVFKKETNSFVVGKIYKFSDAEKSGLKLDDTILAINGKDFDNLTYANYCSNISVGKPSFIMEGKTVVISVLRGGKKLDFEFDKYPLFK